MTLRPPLHLGVVAVEKGAFVSLPTTVTNFTLREVKYFFYYILFYYERFIGVNLFSEIFC